MNKDLSKRNKNLIIFLIITLSLFILIIASTVTNETLEFLKDYKFKYFFYLIGLWIFTVTADTIALMFFTRGAGEKISLLNSFRTTAVKVYLNVITPFTAGGQPMMVYTMNSYGIPPGKGSSIVITKLITVAAWNFIGAVTCLTFFRSMITTSNALNLIFLISGIFFLVSISIGVAALLSPKIQHKLGRFVTFLGTKVRLIKDPKKVEGFINREACQTRESFKQYFSSKGIANFLLGVFFNLLLYAGHVAIMILLIRGFGIELPLLEIIVKSAVLIFSLSFVPIPAGLLGGEASYWLIFTPAIPDEIKGIIVIMWRLVLQFLTAAIGGFLTAKHFSKLIKDNNETASLALDSNIAEEGKNEK